MKSVSQRILYKYLDKRGLRLINTRDEGGRSLKAQSLPGFFTKAECQKLYNLGLLTKGPILEIGHFLGRSTACLCEAINDSKKIRLFNSYDLGFVSAKEFKEFYDEVHKRDVPLPTLFQEEVFSKKTTTTEVASQNLRKLGLEKYVNLVSGNFIELDHNMYDFIFCDAVHEPHEIRLNLPPVIERSVEGCIWAFHDMNDQNIELVLQLSNAHFIERVHSLGVFIFLGKP